MTTRRELLAAAALLAPLSLAAKTAQAVEKQAEGGRGMADFLFVQNARGIAYSDGKLTLKGASPATVMFADRPERIAGHMATARFVPFWGEGKDSFLSDSPNAALSFLEDEALADAVVELQDPVLSGDDLSYRVKILEGEIPASAGLASLFIDVIGMPLTPLSFAGVRRRVAAGGLALKSIDCRSFRQRRASVPYPKRASNHVSKAHPCIHSYRRRTGSFGRSARGVVGRRRHR